MAETAVWPNFFLMNISLLLKDLKFSLLFAVKVYGDKGKLKKQLVYFVSFSDKRSSHYSC